MKAWVNGIECQFFYDEAIPPEQAPEGFPYIFYLRHDENNWIKPVSIEPYVFVNFFGTVFMKNKLEFDKNRYIDVKRFKFEGYYVVFGLRKSAANKMLGL
jgi:Large polyvalent protein associated domain 28